MKAITDDNKLPKFLVVSAEPETHNYNKFLLKSWTKGEVVKVHSDQTPSETLSTTLMDFRKRYVKVIRKDENGNWNLVYTQNWKSFNLLTKK